MSSRTHDRDLIEVLEPTVAPHPTLSGETITTWASYGPKRFIRGNVQDYGVIPAEAGGQLSIQDVQQIHVDLRLRDVHGDCTGDDQAIVPRDHFILDGTEYEAQQERQRRRRRSHTVLYGRRLA